MNERPKQKCIYCSKTVRRYKKWIDWSNRCFHYKCKKTWGSFHIQYPHLKYMNKIINFGRHKGKTFMELCKNYKDYCNWVLSCKSIQPFLQSFIIKYFE